MTQAKRNKTLSGSFVFAGWAYGVLLFFLVLIWFLPERAQVITPSGLYVARDFFRGDGEHCVSRGQGER